MLPSILTENAKIVLKYPLTIKFKMGINIEVGERSWKGQHFCFIQVFSWLDEAHHIREGNLLFLVC